jgi:hypothetical protein
MDIHSSDKCRLYGILFDKIEGLWHEVLPFLERALAYSDGKFKADDVKKMLIERDMQLWLIYNNTGLKGICITQIIEYPQSKRLGIPFIAGTDFKEWKSGWYVIREWALEHGCDSVETQGRDGWERELKPFGFKKIHTALRLLL